mmetsp:Transcript_17650/g.24519  ORF Transcript_17650/g.24519 Transcript_17650/m.24519 type:complete len:209 (+) Transcript_17650:380-1006(+)
MELFAGSVFQSLLHAAPSAVPIQKYSLSDFGNFVRLPYLAFLLLFLCFLFSLLVIVVVVVVNVVHELFLSFSETSGYTPSSWHHKLFLVFLLLLCCWHQLGPEQWIIQIQFRFSIGSCESSFRKSAQPNSAEVLFRLLDNNSSLQNLVNVFFAKFVILIFLLVEQIISTVFQQRIYELLINVLGVAQVNSFSFIFAWTRSDLGQDNRI